MTWAVGLEEELEAELHLTGDADGRADRAEVGDRVG
jgi:hypothetical protein